MRVLLIGGGDLVQQIAHYIKAHDVSAQVVGFVDDFAIEDAERYDLICLGKINDILELYANHEFEAIMIGIGYNHFKFRQQLFVCLYEKIPFYTFIHPTAFVDISATIGVGSCIGPNAVIEQRAVIGPNVFLYGGVNVSHDSKIGAHSFIAPSVAIAGFVEIGSRCFIGMHTSVVERVCIADDIIVGAGALVLKDMLEPGIYIGAPAYKK